MNRKNIGTESNKSNSLIPAPAMNILGVPIWGLRLEEFVELAKKLIKAGGKVLFSTVGAHSIAVSQSCADFLDHFQQADVVLPDGIMPVWAARVLRHNIPERVPGPDFVGLFLSTAEDERFKVFFMGSTDDTLRRLKSNCFERYPHLNIAGVLAPPFGEFDEETDREIVAAINKTRPDVLCVGITAPKQELWLSRNFERLDVLFAMGVGAAFDYLAGKKQRVPRWLGQLGFEWLYRLLNEPRHVWRRNVNNAVFWWLLAKNYLRSIFVK